MHGWSFSPQFVGRSFLVISASACSVWWPRFESQCERLCLFRWILRYAALGTGCALLQCLRQLSLASLCGVVKSSTSFGRDKGGNVISAGWHVTVCDRIWHVSSCSGEAGLLTKGNRYTAFTYLIYFYCPPRDDTPYTTGPLFTYLFNPPACSTDVYESRDRWRNLLDNELHLRNEFVVKRVHKFGSTG